MTSQTRITVSTVLVLSDARFADMVPPGVR